VSPKKHWAIFERNRWAGGPEQKSDGAFVPFIYSVNTSITHLDAVSAWFWYSSALLRGIMHISKPLASKYFP